jgi:hypothetical protein
MAVGTQAAKCVHLAVDARCDFDGDSCTIDTCDPAHSTLPSGCVLSGYKKDGTACDDGNACTDKDKCVAIGTDPSGHDVTRCAPGKPKAGARECDGNPCTTNDSCSSAGICTPGTAAAPVGTACDDGNVCTTGDHCDIRASKPVCVGTAGNDNMVCSDNNVCTNGDRCQAGSCVGQRLANGTACDDGSRCTADAGDVCQAGTCHGGTTRSCSGLGLTQVACEPSDGLCCGTASGKELCK